MKLIFQAGFQFEIYLTYVLNSAASLLPFRIRLYRRNKIDFRIIHMNLM